MRISAPASLERAGAARSGRAPPPGRSRQRSIAGRVALDQRVEVGLHLVDPAVGSTRVAEPQASAMATWSPAMVRPSRADPGREVAAALLGRQAGGEHVAHGGAGELPPLGGAHEELAEDRQVGVVAAELRQRGQHVRVAVLGQDPGDLDVGVRAGLDLAEDLEDGGLVEHHRAVGVLEDDRPTHLDHGVGRHEVEDGDGEVGVDEGVVQHHVAVGARHDRRGARAPCPRGTPATARWAVRR